MRSGVMYLRTCLLRPTCNSFWLSLFIKLDGILPHVCTEEKKKKEFLSPKEKENVSFDFSESSCFLKNMY